MYQLEQGTWLDTTRVGGGAPVRIMGVINLSPESFYSESVRTGRDALAARAEAMAREGADLLDVGAMSTAPYNDTAIPLAEEIRRLEAAIPIIRAASGLPVAVDSPRAPAAAAALAAGATTLNAISGLHQDADMARVAADAKGVILMAGERPGAPGDPVAQVLHSWQSSLAIARRAGVDPRLIVLDPGIGFFRGGPLPWHEWDIQVLRQLRRLTDIGYPLFVGVSRKSFIGERLQRPDPADRLAGSLAAATLAVSQGAAVIRTHDVGATRDAVRLAEIILGRPDSPDSP
ncbi:MAG: dihydropteroate synthase [Candidatus Sericytochromatia bacterium]|nr:dihydropteroate synthase [Candidatus Sericytochromatia bacterium]